MWAAVTDPDLNLKCDLTIKLVIEQVCDRILFAVWFVKTSNIVNVNCSEICFLMTDKMRVFDNYMKQYNETSVLLNQASIDSFIKLLKNWSQIFQWEKILIV